MKCVSYTRMATCLYGRTIPSKTISQQNQEIAKYAKERGWKVDAKYSDRKNSESEDSAFQQLRQDGMARKYDMVIVYSIFRCGRSVSYAEDLLLKALLPAGIHFAVVENRFCSLEHTLEETRNYLAEKRRTSNISKLRESEREKEREGFFDLHDEKYGFRLKPDFTGFEIDDEAAPVIREIFERLADNATMPAVAKELNLRGVEPPSVHLSRVGTKNFQPIVREWTAGSIQRIVRNTAYAGYWTKMVDGEKKTVTTPAIVDRELFERAGSKVSSRSKQKKEFEKSDNDFVKRIYDKDSGKPLVCRKHPEAGGSQVFHRTYWSTSEGIPYETVACLVLLAIKKEKAQAELMASMVGSKEVIAEKNRLLKEVADEAKTVFAEMDALQRNKLCAYRKLRNGEINQEELMLAMSRADNNMRDLEVSFEALVQKAEKTEKAFSDKNPWIAFYNCLEIPDAITKAVIKNMVKRVWVKDLSSVEIEMPLQEWKQYFSNTWLNGGVADGQKE